VLQFGDSKLTSSGNQIGSGVTVYRKLCIGMLTSGLVLLIITPLSYDVSSLLSRVVLVASFVVALCSVLFASLGRSSRLALIALLLTSCIFLLWRFSFLMPRYVERALNSETYVFAQECGELGRLTFGSAHSYFFGPYLVLYVLQSLAGLSAVAALYFSLFVYGILTALVATLVLRVIWRMTERTENSSAVQSVLAGCVAFAVVSFMYSARSAIRAGFPQLYGLVVLLAVFFAIGRGLTRPSNVIIELFLIVGLTLGSADGILLVVPFFLLFSVVRRKGGLAFALIPLAYMVYAAYSYVSSLAFYWAFAWGGLSEFIGEVLSNELSARIFPWGRVISVTREDAFVGSVTYVSFMLLCLSVALVSTFISLRYRKGREEDNPDVSAGVRSSSICLWLMLVVAGVSYVGASIRPETFSSDIRTIAIVLPSLLLLIPFMSTRFIASISAKNALVAVMIILIVLGSLRGIYEVYPKSAHDPINVIEDGRLGSTTVFAAAKYIRTYGEATKIVGDYKLLNLAGALLGSAQYEEGWFDQMAMNSPSEVLSEGGILAFNLEGTVYPSIYHASNAYASAYNFSIVNNRLYDNGVVVIASAIG